MSLNVASAINYNRNRGYSQKAIGIIQMFVNCRTTGVFDQQTVQAIYDMQKSPLYPIKFTPDGKCGPKTLGIMILEFEHAFRQMEANVLRQYEYIINGVPSNNKPSAPSQNNGKKNDPEPVEGELSPENKDKPRPVLRHSLLNWRMPGGTAIPNNLQWNGDPLIVGNYYLATHDIRKILAGTREEIVYIVVKSESDALDPFLVGKVFIQTNKGFVSDVRSSWSRQVYLNGKGGAEAAKKEVELLMGAVLASVGTAHGVAAVTAAVLNVLFNNSEDIFKAARGIEELIKVKNVLSQRTPEFWKLCKTALKLSLVKTPEAMWSDPYASAKLAGELVVLVGEAALTRRVRSLGFVGEIVTKLMQGGFGKLTDAATLALAGKDLVNLMKEYYPELSEKQAEARATEIIKELKDNWAVVEPALKSLKAVADQLAGA